MMALASKSLRTRAVWHWSRDGLVPLAPSRSSQASIRLPHVMHSKCPEDNDETR